MKTFIYLIEFILVKILFILFRIIGYKTSSNLGFFIGKTFGPIFRSKKLIINNLKKANLNNQDSLEKITSNVLGNYGRIFSEYMHLKNFKNNKLKNYISIKGLEHLKNLKKTKKRAVFISGHFNNFELMAMQIEKAGIELATIYRPLNNVFLNPFMELIRKKFVCKNQIKKGLSGVKDCIDYINSKHNIALMIDQRVSEGDRITFFNSKAFTTTLPAQLALKYNLKIIPIFIERKNINKFEMEIYNPIDSSVF